MLSCHVQCFVTLEIYPVPFLPLNLYTLPFKAIRHLHTSRLNSRQHSDLHTNNYSWSQNRQELSREKAIRPRLWLSLLFLQRWILLPDCSPNLGLLAICSILRHHSQCHPSVFNIIDRIGSLSRKCKRAWLHSLSLLGCQSCHHLS